MSTNTIHTTETLNAMTNATLLDVLNQLGGTAPKKASKATLVAGILALQEKAQQEQAPAEAKSEAKRTARTYDDTLAVVADIASELQLTCKAGVGSRANSVIINRDKQRIARVQLTRDANILLVVLSNGTRANIAVSDAHDHIVSLITARDAKAAEKKAKKEESKQEEEA